MGGGKVGGGKRHGSWSPASVFRLSKADYVTVVNIGLGVLAMMYTFDATPFSLRIGAAVVFVVLILDGVDGLLARKYGASPVGRYLDSLSDEISFVAVPSLFVYVAAYRPGLSALRDFHNFVVVSSIVLYASLGSLRLAVISLSESTGKRFFVGAPVSVVMTMVFSACMFLLPDNSWPYFADGFEMILPAILLFTSPMLVLSVEYPRFDTPIRLLVAGTVLSFGITGVVLPVFFRWASLLSFSAGCLVFISSIAYLLSPLFIGRRLERKK